MTYRRKHISIEAANGVGFAAVGGLWRLEFGRRVWGRRVGLKGVVVLLLLWRLYLWLFLLFLSAFPSLFLLTNPH